MGVVLRRYIDFLILLIPTPLVSVLFCSSTIVFTQYISNPNVTTFQSNCAEGLHFSAFIISSSL